MPSNVVKKSDIDWIRLIIFVGGLPISILLAGDIHKQFSSNSDAMAAVAGVCATFAGFIVAILTLLGDAAALLPGSWRIASAHVAEINNRFGRLQYIFFCYLFCSFFSLYCMVTENVLTPAREFIGYMTCVNVIYCFIISFELPRSLKTIQRERADAVIAARKAQGVTQSGSVPIPSEVDSD